MSKPDAEIKSDVEAELRWSPEIDETDIAIKVNKGVVALTGFVRTYYEKYRAETIVKQVAGVAGVANDIAVQLVPGRDHTDPEIAREAVEALTRESTWAPGAIKPVVKQGHVTLEGSVAWQYQRERAVHAIAKLKGVTGVTNSIRVAPTVSTSDIKHKIEDAFRRSATVDASHVVVDANGSEVILRGEVRSWAERDQAQASAWSAPGVTAVKNELSIRT
jgi:osmotically-inducible protein OsmY